MNSKYQIEQMEKISEYKEKYAKLFPELNERPRRLLAASDAMMLEYEGIEVIHKASKFASGGQS